VTPLTPEARTLALSSLRGWTFDEARNALHVTLRFPSCTEAVAFMARIAIAADAADHHPEWSNVHDRVDIWLTTHDADGVSERDVSLARTINAALTGQD
jgi:4a-hydroxytetrahydrobiopterin dehydratase